MNSNRRKIFVRLAVAICMLAIVPIYIWRFITLNKLYPDGEYQRIEIGDTVMIDSLECTVLEAKLVTAETYAKMLDSDLAFLGLSEDDIIAITTIQVKNDTSEDASALDFYEAVLKCGNWSNGVEYVLCEDFGASFSPKSVTNITASTIVNSKLESIYKGGKDWRIELSGWPNRIEMLLPMDSSEVER